MMRKYLNLENITRYVLMIALFFPLFYASFALFPSYYGKTAIFQILVEIAFILYLILILRGQIKKPKLNYIFYFLAAFLGIRLIAGFVGLNPEKSFWGTMARMDGNFAWLHFFVYFYLLTQFFETKRKWFRILKLAVFTSFLVAITGIMQRFGIVLFDWWSYEIGGRIFGVMGNSIPFASYILFSIFICAYLFVESIKNAVQVIPKEVININGEKGVVLNEVHLKHLLAVLVWVIILAVNVVALFWSGTRGPMLSFLAVAPVSIFLFGLMSQRKNVRIIFFILFLTAVLSVIFLIFLYSNNAGFSFINSSFELLKLGGNASTLTTRIMNWNSALNGWIENWHSILIGYGPEVYDVIFDKYYKSELLNFSFYETVGDKPHNIIFELLTSVGIAGFVVYAGLFGCIIFGLASAARKKNISKISAAILMLSFVTYLSQNLFEFDTSGVLLLFFVNLAFTSFVIYGSGVEENKIKLNYIFTFLLLAIMPVALWVGSARPLIASYYIVKASFYASAPLNFFIKEGAEQWRNYAQKALNAPSVFEDEARVHIANQIFSINAREMFFGNALNIDILKLLYEKLKETSQNHPKTYAYKHRLAQIESMMGEYADKKYFDDSENTFRELGVENPERQAIGLAWAQMRMTKGDLSGAVKILHDLSEKNPKSDEIYTYLGIALVSAGREEEALEVFIKSLEFGKYLYTRDEFIDTLIYLLQKKEEYKKIITTYLHLTKQYESEPRRAAVWYTRLAATYAKIGDRENAIKAAEQAAFFDKTLSESTRKFIESLN